MSRRRALVVSTRMPAFDRDSGSQDVDNTIRWLLRAGWAVTFLSREEADVAEERHSRRLQQMGVATHAGFSGAERLLRSNEFDLALIAYWEPSAQILPLIRTHCPGTRVLINSMDIHFLRNARRAFSQLEGLGDDFGVRATRELNTYHAADGVIAVSDKERDLLGDFLGEDRVFTLPLAEQIDRSPYELDDRSGMFFVGNFRHVPNLEAVEYLCNEVLPLLDPQLLARHPLRVLGNWLDQVTLDVDPEAPGIHLVGWVPTVKPYVEQSRLAVVPLLHGAGVKRKVIQSMMAGTPVVTTPVGAEGLDLVQGTHALVAHDAADFAAGITRLLTDDELWQRMARVGAEHVDDRHGLDIIEETFLHIVDRVMGADKRSRSVSSGSDGADDDDASAAAVRSRVQLLGRPGDIALVVTAGDETWSDVRTLECWPFPQGRDGDHAGFEPFDGQAAINHLEAQRGQGAKLFVLPRAAFGWRHRYPELFAHLDERYSRVHQDEHVLVHDLSGVHDAIALDPVPAATVRVIGTYDARRTGPPTTMVTELGASQVLVVDQHWRTDAVPFDPAALTQTDEADYTVFISDCAVLPGRFLDTLIATQATLDVDRLQPTHRNGPAAAPPATERHFGTVAREVDEVTPLPVLSVRSGAEPAGVTTLADGLTIGLRRDVGLDESVSGLIRRVWVADADRRPVVQQVDEPDATPRISVLIATYERPVLLAACLASFVDQSLDRSEYELVVVDDGSTRGQLDEVLADLPDDLRVTAIRIAHAGRSAAKNIAVLLARSPIVLFFDDDDRAEPDYLEKHLTGHEAHPGEAEAILGHTDWAPELERTPVMHYITDVDRLMFAYERLGDGQQLDWRGFWEGRISCKRALLVQRGLHDQRLNYSIDVEMAWRLAPSGLRVIYDSSARSLMARPIDFDAFCDRTEAKGRAHSIIAALHPGTEMAARLDLDGAAKLWEDKGLTEQSLRLRVAALEEQCQTDQSALSDLHEAYRSTFRLMHAKGVAGATEGKTEMSGPPTTVQPFPNTDPEFVYDGSPAEASDAPQVSIAIPVWSRTPELAEMVRATIDRIWAVATVPTEVVVIDNGSPHDVPLAAKVFRYPENKGVATGWNAGVRLSTAPMVVILNSDCRVEPGWDRALLEAASDGRRIAFPYTDHCDARGFTSPDQAGTAGWCFMFSKALYDEIGVFDEWFNPAFCEDTDYWHRCWEAGVELSPVPAARVVHARRTTLSRDSRSDMLLQAHRYKYGWKHGVDPDRAPPYYNRDYEDYVASPVER